jgi:hypothetical protein
MFPWQTAQLVPVTFVCPHCKEEQVQVSGQVILCTCEGAERERVETRERAQRPGPRVDLVKLRQQRKIGSK